MSPRALANYKAYQKKYRIENQKKRTAYFRNYARKTKLKVKAKQCGVQIIEKQIKTQRQLEIEGIERWQSKILKFVGI